jgi:hypothetical protein
MYKEIFRWVIAIISQPAKAWVLLAKKGEKQEEFLSRFVYPLIGFVWQGIFKREKDLKLWLRFVGYSSSLMFALNIVLMLLPEFFFLRIFILYTFYIVWEGAGPYMGVEEKIRLKFVGFTTAIILLTPAVIEILLSMLMPGLSF